MPRPRSPARCCRSTRAARSPSTERKGPPMLTKEQNELICHVGPGTPGGEFLRRYWQAVAFSSDVEPGGQPKAITIMGEELVLFRDDAGRPGLLGLRCSHRLTSLGYGRVEDGGIRCPFHGWLYDVHGHCLEQPAEPT